MVTEIDTVECIVCHKQHFTTPVAREDGTYRAKDWPYYNDLYNGVYGPICKGEHDALMAPKKVH